MKRLKCDMSGACQSPVTHIGEKGWVYCRAHAQERRAGGRERCRTLRLWELDLLSGGDPLPSYAPISMRDAEAAYLRAGTQMLRPPRAGAKRMKRASYRDAIEWIALNDSAADDGALDPAIVAELVTSTLVADVFGVTTERVGADVVRVRRKEQP